MTMQFVVGATPTPTAPYWARSGRLSAGGGIHHAHFSAFRPIANTPLEGAPAAPALREHRLYQADHLLRSYGFEANEVVFEPDGNLPLAVDPKAAWAIAHPERFPVEVRTASPEELLASPASARPRLDGSWPSERRPFCNLADLGKLGVVTNRAAGFITLSGRRVQTSRWIQQLGFWAPEAEVGITPPGLSGKPRTFR